MTAPAQQYSTTRIVDLKPHPLNPNEGDVDAIEESIRQNGWYGVVLVQKSSGYTIAGWHRTLAAQRIGFTAVPTQILDVDDTTALRIMAVDNESNRRGQYNDEVLARLLQEINDGDDASGLIGTGFGDSDLEDLLAQIDTANYQPTVANLDDAHPGNLGGLPQPAPVPSLDAPTAGGPPEPNYKDKFTADAQRLDGTRRLVVLDLPIDRFTWLIAGLEKVCQDEQLKTNTDAVLRLVSDYTGEPVPAADSSATDDR